MLDDLMGVYLRIARRSEEEEMDTLEDAIHSAYLADESPGAELTYQGHVSELAALRAAAEEGKRYKAAVEKLERCALNIDLLGGHYIVCATRGELWNYGHNPTGHEPTLLAAIEAAKEE
jgi:hypothetical protein